MPRRIQDDPRPRKPSPGQRRSTPLPVDWAARREAVIARDRCCRWILENGRRCHVSINLECDHIGSNTDHSLENLQALCRYHHSIKTAKQGWRAAVKNRPQRKRPPEKHPGIL